MERQNRILDNFCNNSGFLDNIFENSNLGIITGRMTGKSILSSFILLKYINSLNYSPKIYSLSQEHILAQKMDQIGYYYNVNNENKKKLIFDSKSLTEYNSISKIVQLVKGGVKMDILFIDEIFYYKFTDYEMETLFEILRKRETKIIFNSTIPDWTKIEYINKLKQVLDFILIDDKMLNNLRGYNINLKLKNIVNRINEKERDCNYI